MLIGNTDRPATSHRLLGGLLAVSAILLLGCRTEYEISSYKIDKKTLGGGPSRTIGAIVPKGDLTWFFKLIGPADATESLEEPFTQLIRSIQFDDRGQPRWTLPNGWTEQPGQGMRYATISLAASDQTLELTVIPLPTAGSSLDEYVLANVNRWRGEVGLPPISTAEIPQQSVAIELGETTAYVVNLVGQRAAGMGMGAAPFAGSGAPRLPADPAPAPSQAAGPSVTFETPPGWKPAANDSFSVHAFEAGDPAQPVRVTLTPLAVQAADLEANLNRWRRNLGLPPATLAELQQQLTDVQVGDAPGRYIRIDGPEDQQPRQAMLGVITIQAGQAWFIKLIGAATVVDAQTANFDAFVQSIKFTTDSQGAQDGN